MKQLLSLLAPLALLLQAPAHPLPGQIVIDPDHPQWLMRQGGEHVFICGPGDPEDFLYAGKRNADGTRDGDQVARIKKLIEHGGNCIYMQAVRTHGGDAKADKTQNPFVDSDPAKGLDKRILDQWEAWFSLMDQHGILIYLFFYDDGARIWNTGDRVGPEEKTFVETIVRRFKHHKNLIWVVGEESEERYTTARVQGIAEIIKNADDYGHIIGDHHHSGTTFKAWRPDGALQHFSMQLSKTGEEAHAGAVEAIGEAAGNYQIIYSESTATPADADGMRRHAWSVAMAGAMPMLLGMDIAGTPVESLQQCRYLHTFFETTDFWTMASHDELKHSSTKYVLADPGRSCIIYSDHSSGRLGIKDLPAGKFDVTWLDCRTGATSSVGTSFDQPGDHTFEKPRQIAEECAAWIRLAGKKAAATAELKKQPGAATAVARTMNRAPKATGKEFTTSRGTPLYVQLEFEDDDGPGPYRYTIAQEPEHGTLSGSDNDRTFTPKSAFVGVDRFTWKVNDGKADSNTVTVRIEVGEGREVKPAGPTKAYFPTPDSLGGWRTALDADGARRLAGMDIKKVDETFALIQDNTKNGGLLVLRHGWLVYERYFGLGHREATPNLASCGKSFTSIAVGILMNERHDMFPDGLDQKVFTPRYFPSEAFPLSDPRKADIKLGQLLAFTAGIRGNNPSYVNGKATNIDPMGPDGWQAKVDDFALGRRDGATGKIPFSTATLWCDPGEGYSYSSSSIHLASIMLRHLAGMELQEYLEKHLAGSLGWGRWGYGYKDHPQEVSHTPGGGGIALRATDMLRFGYMLLREGRWNDEQLVPSEYVRLCSRRSTYNRHYPYSLQFNVNTDGDIPELPRDAFWKAGSGGHCLYVVPSLDLVVWKLGGRDDQYSPGNTGLPASPASKKEVAARRNWKATVRDDAARRRTLEMVIGAIERR